MNKISKTKRAMRLSSLSAFVFALAAALALVFAFSGAGTAYASGAALYENPNTGEIFLTPGPGRVKVGQSVVNQLLKPNAKKTTRQINNLKATEKKLEASLKTVKGETLPAWTKHITLGTLVYMGYGYYTQTGFAPALQLQENPAGPGNNGYNAFNVNRAYLIFLYHQDNWFLKLTPNINKSNNYNGAGTGSNWYTGGTTTPVSWASSSGTTFGNEYFRLKYAFLQFNHVYDANGLTVNLKAGQFPTPMIAWEDGLLGYHVAERTPWGVLGVTSTQAGLGVSGKFRSNGKIYIAYNAGFFDNATFHQGEDIDQKSPQARVSFYPMGADSNLDGLGISGYYAWSQSNNFEGYYGVNANNDNPTARASAILDYKTPQGVIAAQFDYGLNALAGGYASGAGSISQDTGSFCGLNPSGAYVCNAAGAAYPAFAADLGSLNTYQHNTEHGYDAFGYYNIPNSKFGVFGLIQRFYYSDPSTAFWVNKIGTNITSGNPYDSQRGVVGVAYHLNSHITLTADWQNYQFLYAKDYRNLPASNLEYSDYGQWMGQTNAYFLQARIAF